MKKVQLLVVAVITVFCLNAQNTSGTINYEQVVKLDIKLEGDAAQFAEMMPKERRSNKVMYFNQEASLFTNGKQKEEETMAMSSGHGNVMIKMQEPDNKVYTEFKSKIKLEQREFMTRIFLIEDKINQQWKLTGNQKMILDFPCQEAISETDSIKTTAWFTPVIPVSVGPANYGGLPGAILSIETDGSKKTVTATSVIFSEIDEKILTKPKKGKKVKREEYNQIVEEKMKEMGAEHGDGKQVIIRMHR